MTKQQEKLLENFIRKEVRKSLKEDSGLNQKFHPRQVDSKIYEIQRACAKAREKILKDQFDLNSLSDFLEDVNSNLSILNRMIQ